MPIEFFTCPCPDTANVILDGVDQGPNKDAAGKLLTMQCNTGRHRISLQCPSGNACSPPDVTLAIKKTNPISPLEVPFACAP